jgi:hypothetical protein
MQGTERRAVNDCMFWNIEHLVKPRMENEQTNLDSSHQSESDKAQTFQRTGFVAET